MFLQATGVPQGSVLGPLLFNIYINDIAQNIQSTSKLYADDLKLSCIVNKENNCNILQNDMKELNKWCAENNLQLNLEKCFVMSFSNKLNEIANNYVINNQSLTKVSSFKDLVITYDSKLKFTEHVLDTIKKSSRMLGFVIRTARHFRNIE